MRVKKYDKFYRGKYYGRWEDSYPDEYEYGYGYDDYENLADSGEDYITLFNGNDILVNVVSDLWEVVYKYEKAVKIAEENIRDDIKAGQQYVELDGNLYTIQEINDMDVSEIYTVQTFSCEEPDCEPDYDDYYDRYED